MYEYEINYIMRGNIIIKSDTEEDALDKFDATSFEELVKNLRHEDIYTANKVECLGEAS